MSAITPQEITSKDAERHRAKMEKRKAVQDAEVAEKTVRRRACSSSIPGPGKGKSTAAFGLALAHPRSWWPRRRGAVHQGRVVDSAEQRRRLPSSATASSGTRWAKASPGRPRTSKRDVAAAEKAWEKALELMADESDRARHPGRAQHRASLRLSADLT
jgi:cob(I)alamin adenosyltransferase